MNCGLRQLLADSGHPCSRANARDRRSDQDTELLAPNPKRVRRNEAEDQDRTNGHRREIDLGREPKPSDAKDPLLTLDDMLGQLPATYNTPLLLMLDEVQGLAAPGHLAFVAALRTSLDKRRDTVRTIFTGSSMDGLRAMFTNRQAPFFYFGSNIELPPLGEDFVRHVLAAHKAATKREAPLEPAMEFFDQVDRSPFMMRSVLERMALKPDDHFETAAYKV